MAARDRNAGLGADRLAALEDPLDHGHRELLERHADDGEREDRPPAHCINVGDRIGGCDAAEVERIVDDRGKEIGGRDQRLLVVQAVDRGVVGGFRSNEQFLGQAADRRRGKNLREHRGRDLAAAAAAVAEFGQANRVRCAVRCIHKRRILRWNFAPTTALSIAARRPSTPRTISPGRSRRRCSTMRSGPPWAPYTSRSRPSTPRSSARPWWRRTLPGTSRHSSLERTAAGGRSFIAGAAASARRPWRISCARWAGKRRRSRAATAATAGGLARNWRPSLGSLKKKTIQ